MSDAVPTLDARAAAAAHFAHDLAAAYAEYGFVIIQNHGIDKQVIDQCLACFRRFFALPDAEKRRYQLPNGGGARGYTPFGIETAKGARHHDLKEFWHVGRELPPGHRYARDMAPNIWVEGIAGFRESTLSLYEAFDALGRRLLAPIARTIGLPENYFDDKVNYGNSVLRVIHYPPMPPEPTPSVRAGAHEDINFITLLVGASAAGLELLTRAGEWLPITTTGDTVVVNIGDMLQRLTNHVYPSTTHRVVNPPGDHARKPRYSIPFFLHPNPDVVLDPLTNCISADNPRRYDMPITAHEYLQQRLREIRLM